MKQGLGLAAGGVLGLCAARREALAQKSSKTSLLYQDHPHDGRRCGECKYFAESGGSNAGTCTVVEGPVERNGWCMAFSPRP
jgi:high potential iron-sulfur protein